MDQTTKATNSLVTGLQLALKDWPLWLGYAGINYLETLVMQGLAPQGAVIQAISQGFMDTNRQEYFFAHKFPAQAADEIRK